MAYHYRGPQPPPDESQFSNFSGNPLSPPRNPNRLSAGMMGSSNNNDARGSLMRRFTTNALPTLSPIGQQRRQAAGDPQMVSTISPLQLDGGQQVSVKNETTGVQANGNGYGYTFTALGGLLIDSEPPPGMSKFPNIDSVYNSTGFGILHRRGKSCWRAIGDGRSRLSDEDEYTRTENEGGSLLFSTNDVHVYLLTHQDKPTGAYSRVPPSERRIRQIESLLEQQRRINAELEQVDDDTRREVEEGLRHERAVTQMIAQSEPTTPPEYQDAFPTALTRPNRYSTTSLTSPPGINSRPSRSSAHFTSPPGGFARPYTATNNSNLPSQSVPGSRRQSDDEEEEDDFLFRSYDSTLHRAAAKPNRNSMPVTSYDRKRNTADLTSTLGPLNSTSFLFDADQPSVRPNKSSTKTSPADTKTYLQMQHTEDGFPKLIRRGDNGEPVAGPSTALDLALSQAANSEQQATERATASRHRISLPPSALSSNGTIAPLNSILANANDAKSAANNRRSMEVKFTAETKRPSLASPPRVISNGVPKVQASYSTNDIPTMKSINGENSGGVSLTSPSTLPSNIVDTSSVEQNTGTISRVATGSSSYQQSQDFTAATSPQENSNDSFSALNGLQAGAAPFGPMQTPGQNQMHNLSSPTMSQYGQPSYYGNYGMPALNNGLNNMNIGGGYESQGQWPNQMPPTQVPQYQPGGYSSYPQHPQNGQIVAGAGRYADPNQRAMMQQRKQQADELFSAVAIPDLVGQIYGLCKDQHGCRFLQRKLEERNEQDIQTIFEEVKGHFTELMVDPFGNYLCQRLLEYANDEQRTVLVENAVSAMSRIALNQHGTRALQRMIEFISTPEQTNLIIGALRFDVVSLIQDLNGNHVIQKCLNHLSSHDAQFIFDAVSANCTIVGTHRHGCCVLQRCVDHASGVQKGALVDSIVANAFALVQDPFGNYVVQYIVDLSEPSFTEPMCRSLAGSIAFLSKQKFSSNVIEKCIRCSSPETRRMLILEITPANEIEKLLRDSFANYVVQTAMDFADEDTKALLIDNIRPIIPSIRHTPYGRRIQQKINEYDGNTTFTGNSSSNASPGSVPTYDANATAMPYSSRGQGGRGNRNGMVGPPPHWSGNDFSSSGAHGAYLNGGMNGGVNGGMNGGMNSSMNGGMNGGMNNSNISAPTPQRNQAYALLNGTHNFPNGGYGGQGFPAPSFNGQQGYRPNHDPPYGGF